ncbi:MAG TPA: sigma-70 family RNA polymerase sigma factor [Pirellulales bacterium]|nr:sigma-70 family RNA polymerase sigma factor [Pirellulales bacterium]
MSTKRQPRRNAESCESIKAHFISIGNGSCRQPWQWIETWERLIDDSWFRTEVEICSHRVVEHCYLSPDLCDDLSQEVILLLAAKLSSAPDLDCDPELLPEKFEAWMGTIIYHCCVDALRHLLELYPPHSAIIDCPALANGSESIDIRLDVAAAAGHLAGRVREVTVLRLKDRTYGEIAEALSITERMVRYTLEEAKAILAPLLCGYGDEER